MSRDNYVDHQREQNAAYSQAYADWVAKLSPKQREELRDSGLDAPDLPSYRTYKPDHEAFVEHVAASEDCDEDLDTIPETSDAVREEAMAMVRSILGEIMSQDNARLALDCFALVTGVGYLGESMTTIAKRHGVTRAAVSKRCIMIGNALNLPPSPAMRRLTARKAYEQRAKEHHAGTGH